MVHSAVALPPVTVLPLSPTHYDVLDLAESASAEAVRQAVTTLGSRAHSTPERRLASAVLSDPLRRAVYDAYLQRERTALAEQQRRLDWRKRLQPQRFGMALLATGVLWLIWSYWMR